MSQSDYLKYKKVSNIMNIDTNKKQPPVITGDNYVMYKQYNLVNSIVNTKTLYNVLDVSGIQIIYDIRRNPTYCPSMYFCQDTNLRSNRVPMLEVYYTPKCMPLTIKDKKKILDTNKSTCNCTLNSVNTERYICKCKKTHFGTVR